MKIILLRHEKRNLADASFASPLLPRGEVAATTSLPLALTKLGVTHVYASPFTRCMQTIRPFCTTNANFECSVRCDFGLYERIRESSGFQKRTYQNAVHSDFQDMVDATYQSSRPLARIKWNETVDDVRHRAKLFLRYVSQSHSNADVLLVVTHLSVANALLQRTDDDSRLEMGQFETIDITAESSVPSLSPQHRLPPPPPPTTESREQPQIPFQEWLQRSTVRYDLSADMQFNVQAATKTIGGIFNKCITSVMTIGCTLSHSFITPKVYQRLCRWYIYMYATAMRFKYSPTSQLLYTCMQRDLCSTIQTCKQLYNKTVSDWYVKYEAVYTAEENRYRTMVDGDDEDDRI
jgi:broad specificity phosphatase PhoE